MQVCSDRAVQGVTVSKEEKLHIGGAYTLSPFGIHHTQRAHHALYLVTQGPKTSSADYRAHSSSVVAKRLPSRNGL